MTCIESAPSCCFSSGLSVVTNSLCLTPSFFRFLPPFTPFVPPSTLYDSLLFLFFLYCFYPANDLCCLMTKTARIWLHSKETEVLFQKGFFSRKFPGVNRLKLKKANHRIQSTSGNAKEIRHKSSLKVWDEGVWRSWCKCFGYIHCFVAVR
jgi:hypothetical protein